MKTKEHELKTIFITTKKKGAIVPNKDFEDKNWYLGFK